MSKTSPSISEQARRLRSAILDRHGYRSEVDIPTGARGSPVEEAASLATVSAHWGIVSNVPVIGPVIVLAKRVMRIGLRWYINPIVEQQNAFNDAVVRSLYELQAENDRLHAIVGTRDEEPSE